LGREPGGRRFARWHALFCGAMQNYRLYRLVAFIIGFGGEF
jgi:hypothetical protein